MKSLHYNFVVALLDDLLGILVTCHSCLCRLPSALQTAFTHRPGGGMATYWSYLMSLLYLVRCQAVQGYLAHEKPPPTLEPP